MLRAVSTGLDGSGEQEDFLGFSFWPTKWQTSTCPIRPAAFFSNNHSMRHCLNQWQTFSQKAFQGTRLWLGGFSNWPV